MIVCLGWGSLIWHPDDLPTINDWYTDGPGLPIEFARQSRNGRITLVIEPKAKRIPVLWIQMTVPTVDAAQKALANREGVSLSRNPHSIGYWSHNGASRHSETAGISKWAKTRGVNAVVWTELKPRFNNKPATPTRREVVEYLRGLKGLERAKAEEYVRKAPLQIRTAYRKAIELELGWITLPDKGAGQAEPAPN